MDLNTATYHELITLLNIGEVGAASIVMARDSLKRNGRKFNFGGPDVRLWYPW